MLKYYVDQNSLGYYTGKVTNYVDDQIESLSSIIDSKLNKTILNAAVYNNKATAITATLTDYSFIAASGIAREGVNYYTRSGSEGSYTYSLITTGIVAGQTDVSAYYISEDSTFGTKIPTDSAVINYIKSYIDSSALEGRVSTLESTVGGIESDITDINSALGGKIDKTSIDTSIPATALDTNVPSTLLVKTELGNKLSTAVSGAEAGVVVTSIFGTLGNDNTTVPTSKAVKDVTDALSTSIGTNTTNIGLNADAIETLGGRMDTAETNIGNKFDKSDIDTSIPVTAVDTKVPSTLLVKTELGNKLSTAVSGVESGTKATSIKASIENSNSTVPTNAAVYGALADKVNTSDIDTSFSGTTSDSKVPSTKLVKDSLDTKLSTATDASGVTVSGGIVTTLGSDNTTVPTSKAVKDVTDGKISTSAIDTSFPNTALNTNVPSTLLVKSSLEDKLSTAVSGTESGTKASSIVATLGDVHTSVPTSKAVKDVTDGLSTRIGTNATNIETNAGNITSLTTRMGTAETNISGKLNTSNIDTSMPASASDSNVPSTLLVKTELGNKLSTAVSGATSGTVASNISASVDNNNTSVPTGAAVYGAVNAINVLIPTEATSTNQLADKSFVNSSISTATATFRGTFSKTGSGADGLGLAANATDSQIAAALATKISTKDINDYTFVIDVDSSDHPIYKRFKYDGTNFGFEYSLNNSSFTADQWSAINGVASKLGTSDVGAVNIPIYLNDGVATACNYQLNSNVPSGAVFTDTTYSNFGGATSSDNGTAGLVPAPSTSQRTYYLKANGEWADPVSGYATTTYVDNAIGAAIAASY